MTRGAIRQAAAERFFHQGYESTTVREIADALDIRAASIYYHYPDKQQILFELIDSAMTLLADGVRAAVAADDAPADQPDRRRRPPRRAPRPAPPRGDARRDGAAQPDRRAARPRGRPKRDAYEAIVLGVLERGIAAGTWRALDPKLAAYAVISMCTNVGIWYRPDGRLTLPEVAGAYATMAARLVGAAPPDPALVDRVLSSRPSRRTRSDEGGAVGLRTPEEYVESLRRQSPEVYARGETVTNVADHPLFASTMACWGSWVCRAAYEPELRELMVTSPDLNGEECHVFWHMATDADDLLKNLRAARMLSERSPLSGYASIGRDELQALLIVTQRVDRAHGTGYHARVVDFVKRFQREQLMTAAAVTDVKGDRGKRPADQDDPDLYLRVVERRDDGIVVRGAKAHTSGLGGRERARGHPAARDARRRTPTTPSPSRSRSTRRASSSSAAASPARTRTSSRRPVSSHDDLMESFTIFDDVFVPWERVFLCGEAEFAGEVANTFANVNRQGYLGADVGKLRLFIGAAQLAAKLNGVTGAAHIKSKIAEMIRLERSIWALGVTASHESRNEEGYQVPDPVLTNAGKHLAMEGHYMAARNLLEIAGGSVITSPYVEDIFRPELRPYIEKYYRGVDPGDAMERLRVMKLIRDLVASEYGGYWYTEIIHGSGSPEAEKLQMYREHDLEYCVGLARHALLGPGGGRRGADRARVDVLKGPFATLASRMRHEKQIAIRARDVDATGHVARRPRSRSTSRSARDEWLDVIGGSPDVALSYLVRRIDLEYLSRDRSGAVGSVRSRSSSTASAPPASGSARS